MYVKNKVSRQNIETIIASTNAVNRKLEEHVSVGKGFESITALWGQFSDLVTQAGAPAILEGEEGPAHTTETHGPEAHPSSK